MVNIYCVNTGTTKAFPEGTTLLEMLSVFEFERPYPILSAKDIPATSLIRSFIG